MSQKPLNPSGPGFYYNATLHQRLLRFSSTLRYIRSANIIDKRVHQTSDCTTKLWYATAIKDISTTTEAFY
jgi:hypothetical protein